MATLLPADRLALIDLSGPGHYVTWGILQISYANLAVIILMVAVFGLALVLPFPGHSRATGSGAPPSPGSADGDLGVRP